MSASKCCAAFKAKLIWSLIVIAVFGAASILAWDVYGTSAALSTQSFDVDVLKIKFATTTTAAMVVTRLLTVPIQPVFVDQTAGCVSLTTGPSTCHPLLSNGSISIRVGGFSVSEVTTGANDFVSGQMIKSLQTWSLVGGIAAVSVGFVLVMGVMLCCVGCCRCAFCGRDEIGKGKNDKLVTTKYM